MGWFNIKWSLHEMGCNKFKIALPLLDSQLTNFVCLFSISAHIKRIIFRGKTIMLQPILVAAKWASIFVTIHKCVFRGIRKSSMKLWKIWAFYKTNKTNLQNSIIIVVKVCVTNHSQICKCYWKNSYVTKR